MGKKRIPLLLHVNETLGHSYPGKGATPLERFYELIRSFPNLPIVLAHWGGGLPFYELMPEVAKAMSNVYYDTAASPYLYSKKIYAAVSEMVGVKKILSGPTFPSFPLENIFKNWKARVCQRRIREESWGLIYQTC
jgi:predicted TIM-barrel fold metal-dependent hydrolase